MAKGSAEACRAGLVCSIIMLLLALAGCVSRSGGPAPLVNGGESAASAVPAEVVIQPGQTLSGIAHHYHVAMSELAAANHLAPPYRILAGGTLIVPGGAAAPPNGEFAGPPPGTIPAAPALPPGPAATGPVAMAPLPSPGPTPRSARPSFDQGQAYATREAAAPSTEPRVASAAPEQQAGRPIPLDRVPPTAGASLTPPAPVAAPSHENQLGLSAPSPVTHEPAGTAVATAEAPPAAQHHGGTFLWPVRGHIIENYGTGPDGTHNDGINIAAPRGAPVQATDAGIVAYAGNELRGYGNLILIKHPNGWISAYAHCDLILVKKGQKVARGQVIARVGSTGNVNAPQLHFELRRGQRPVDPRDYLAPLPSAAAKAQVSG
ncbi:MAG TPA: peptidoglycan DD-metalloendopeptidase family protein [Stellaceae bacterium]|nr:peptidoglycan DD-metalloendopeptidase family protein [Stellaceae bacterium]